jgi:hypothetical protein
MYDMYLMECKVNTYTVENDMADDHYAICFRHKQDEDVLIMHVSLDKVFQINFLKIKCSEIDKKDKSNSLNEVLAMTSKAFYRWNIQEIDSKSALVISQFELSKKLTKENYEEFIEEKKKVWSKEFFKQVAKSTTLKIRKKNNILVSINLNETTKDKLSDEYPIGKTISEKKDLIKSIQKKILELS